MLRGYCIHCGFPATNKCPICGSSVCTNCLESHDEKHSRTIDEINGAWVKAPTEPAPEQSPVSETVKAEVKKPGRPRTVK